MMQGYGRSAVEVFAALRSLRIMRLRLHLQVVP